MEGLINFFWAIPFESDLSFGVCHVEVGDGLRDGKKAMNVVCGRKHLERYVPGSYAVLRDQSDYLRLPILEGSKVAMEKFFIISDGLTVTAVNERRR